MEKEIVIIDFESKYSKNNKLYHRFNTSEGWLSCWDSELSEKLKEFKGGVVSVEIVESSTGFKNIKGISSEKPVPKKSVLVPENAPYFVSYTKDLFIAMLEKNNGNKIDANGLWLECIKLVKTGVKEFS